jgi:hypothetical protein
MLILFTLNGKLSMVTPWAANRVSVTLQSTSGDDQLEFKGKLILFVGDFLQLPPVVSNLSMPVLCSLITCLHSYPSIRKIRSQKPMRPPNRLWIDFLSSVSSSQTHDIQDWREGQRQLHVTVTKRVDVALSFFCSGLQPQNIFPPDRQ